MECDWPLPHLRHHECDGVTEQRSRERLAAGASFDYARNYTDEEECALRRSYLSANVAQSASGTYWPTELERRAAKASEQASLYLTAAAALRREIERDPRCSTSRTTT